MNSATIAKKDRTRETIKKAYSGGKTEDEAQKILDKKGISLSSHQKHRSDLVKDGGLISVPYEGKGKGLTRFFPADEILIPPNTQGVDLTKEEGTLPVSKGTLISMVIDQAKNIVEAIEKDDAWKNVRTIKKICNNIRPLVHNLAYLESIGFDLTLPWHYFEKEKPPSWKGLFGWKDLRGTLGIPIKASGPEFENYQVKPGLNSLFVVNEFQEIKEKNDVLSISPKDTDGLLWVYIFPSLPEWKRYFLKVIEELDSASRDSNHKIKKKQDKTKGI